MRIAMTGATGLIGKEIGKLLIEKGHTITAFVRDPDQARKSLPFPATLVKWSSGEAVSEEMMNGIEGVINLAGKSIASGRWSAERKKRIIDSRVETTRAFVAASSRVKVFVSGSAVGYYGPRGDESLDETSTKGDGFLADVVAQWEAELTPLKCRVAMIRTSVVLSRHGGAMEKLLPLFERGIAGQLGNGQQWMSWIHLEDIARLFVFALENESVSGVINGTSPVPVRNDEFTKHLAHALGKSVFLPVPEIALKLALGEMSSSVLDSQRAHPARAEQLGFQFLHPEIAATLKEICEPLLEGHHEVLSEQWLPLEPEELFPFYCDEKNLESLTPSFLKFNVLNKSTDQIGSTINYRWARSGTRLRAGKWRATSRKFSPSGAT